MKHFSLHILCQLFHMWLRQTEQHSCMCVDGRKVVKQMFGFFRIKHFVSSAFNTSAALQSFLKNAVSRLLSWSDNIVYVDCK